jgi:AAA domain, putative AbiEii toxin, Type IV TA system
MLTHLVLDDFKSFRHAELELSRLTLLVGANASGKSNVFDAVRCLQGIGLGMAIVEILRGRWEGGRELWPGIRGGPSEVVRHGAREFAITAHWASGDHGDTYRLRCNPRLSSTQASGMFPAVLRGAFFLDLNPRRMRDYVPKSSAHLGAEGQNVSAAVWQLCQTEGRKQDLRDWMSELCAPELSDIDFVETELGDVMLVLVEKDGARISARSLSDGTLRFLGELTALLTAPRGSLILVEEIENGLHPARTHLLLELLTGLTAEREVQVLATTHSPAVLSALADVDLELAKAALVFGRVHDAEPTQERVSTVTPRARSKDPSATA